MTKSLLYPPAEFTHGIFKTVIKDGHSKYYIVINGVDYEVCQEVFEYIDKLIGEKNG